MMDEWTAELRREYPSLEGDTVSKIVELAQLLVRTDISFVEAKHATIRRLVLSRSMQTHMAQSQPISSQRVLLQGNKRNLATAFGQSRPPRSAQPTRGRGLT